MIAENEINLQEIHEKLNNLCLDGEVCSNCEKNKCLIFFAKKVASYVLTKKVTTIRQGMAMIPNHDLKTYSEDDMIETLAMVLQQCKDCRDNHDDDCTINLIRTCMEYALFGDKLPYQGSVTLYLLEAQKSNGRVGDTLKAKYLNRKKTK
ncbi:hypothetical protein H1S01_14025 [Heliobacterium chlorum]|uniref:Uncharacterized protein n=1 Tax=Heliobacterium chlorum TaxID=2698 RepID=A0ABR7T5V4_HELCL|nr:hypothetical protein [Heliobacterium chlorum]MBC9785607.1 hypothetical protein [Heliobacterium chlorum]